jgi:hypothetical protein
MNCTVWQKLFATCFKRLCKRALRGTAIEVITIIKIYAINLFKSRDTSIDTVTGYGLADRMIGVRFPAGAGNFSLRHRVQNGSGAHQHPIQ